MSRLPFELLLALRYLRPKRTFVSIITLISIFGVMLGVAVLIIVISVMNGFDKELREKVLGFTAHLKVMRPDASMPNYTAVISTVASNKNVIGVAPFIVGPVLMKTEPDSGQSLAGAPYIRGVDPALETNVSILPSSVIEGKFDLSRHGVVVGSDFAANMHLAVGDRVALYGQRQLKKLENSKNGEIKSVGLGDDYTVTGIFDVGYYEYDVSMIVVSLENAQDLYDIDDTVHGLFVKLADPMQAPAVAEQLEAALGPDFEVRTWLQESTTMQAVLVEKNVMLYIMFFIVLVAAFGITCTLITFIVLKTSDIGLMKAVGATNRQVMWVFLSQSLIVSVLGVAAGFGLGILALAYRNPFLGLMRHWTGMQLFPSDIYGFTQLPSLVVGSDLIVICGGSLLICLLAAAFPAWYASRLNPVEALRHE
ncbi:MAG TPA: ABC transporter permease [Verrucomicrobiae bacterium]|nr:ABC transporter permease [Verrucomicrobiae bacterium]